MIYRSNLTCPDLSHHFKLRNPPKQILGHDAPSDPDYEPECTYWTHDEAAILYNVAERVGGLWVDVGARFGWTTAHLAEGVLEVIAVDPELRLQGPLNRFEQNTAHCWDSILKIIWNMEETWASDPVVDGVVIDGNHDDPFPFEDALKAFACGADVIIFHDFWGAPIRRGVQALMDRGYNCRVYYTPNGVACCWRGLPDFHPPDHVRDGNIDWRQFEKMIAADFPMERCV